MSLITIDLLLLVWKFSKTISSSMKYKGDMLTWAYFSYSCVKLYSKASDGFLLNIYYCYHDFSFSRLRILLPSCKRGTMQKEYIKPESRWVHGGCPLEVLEGSMLIWASNHLRLYLKTLASGAMLWPVIQDRVPFTVQLAFCWGKLSLPLLLLV